eukprot:10878266-Alexandrium_andersonii.AAC.1
MPCVRLRRALTPSRKADRGHARRVGPDYFRRSVCGCPRPGALAAASVGSHAAGNSTFGCSPSTPATRVGVAAKSRGL